MNQEISEERGAKILKGITIPSPPQILADLQLAMYDPDPDLNAIAMIVNTLCLRSEMLDANLYKEDKQFLNRCGDTCGDVVTIATMVAEDDCDDIASQAVDLVLGNGDLYY